MSKTKQAKISEDQLQFIYGDDYNFFINKILSNCYCRQCPNCQYDATITDYKTFLNDLDDIILQGFCAKCSGPVGRYIETSQVINYEPRIKKVRQSLNKSIIS